MFTTKKTHLLLITELKNDKMITIHMHMFRFECKKDNFELGFESHESINFIQNWLNPALMPTQTSEKRSNVQS